MSLQLTYNITNNNFTLILHISGGIVSSVDWGDGTVVAWGLNHSDQHDVLEGLIARLP